MSLSEALLVIAEKTNRCVLGMEPACKERYEHHSGYITLYHANIWSHSKRWETDAINCSIDNDVPSRYVRCCKLTVVHNILSSFSDLVVDGILNVIL